MSDGEPKDESTDDSEQRAEDQPNTCDQQTERSDEQPAYDQSSSVCPEQEDSKEYVQGPAEADAAAYYAGEQAGRSDTIHKRSSLTPPEYEGNEAYAKGYADGLAAPPYLSDVEAEQKAEEDAGIPKLPNLDVTPPQDLPSYDDEHPQPPSMSPVMPGDLPEPPPEGDDEEMPHAEYGEDDLKRAKGEFESEAVGD